ncbi:hypothetical protein SAMN04487761_10779 [Lachnospiraceae bacterium C7]|nr:hypothetical protein SAMN04487761_10779 [Lachnospiraceae bacterium C7]
MKNNIFLKTLGEMGMILLSAIIASEVIYKFSIKGLAEILVYVGVMAVFELIFNHKKEKRIDGIYGVVAFAIATIISFIKFKESFVIVILIGWALSIIGIFVKKILKDKL